MRNALIEFALIALFATFNGCGGDGNAFTPSGFPPPGKPDIISISISCSQTAVMVNGSTSCRAIVNADTEKVGGVTWSVDIGSIDTIGTFTAPSTTGNAIITATSLDDISKHGTLAVPVRAARPGGATIDRLDDYEFGYQVHVMYVIPGDGIDEHPDTDGTLALSLSALKKWLDDEAGLGFQIDTYKTLPDITFFTLSKTNAEMTALNELALGEIESELVANGFTAINKIYLAYYGGGSNLACGDAAWPPTKPGRLAALYLHGTPPGSPACDTHAFTTSRDVMGYREFSAIRQLFHVLGFVPSCAPNFTASGYVSDSNTDLMYAGNLPWNPEVIDFNHDDYFGAKVSGCPDIFDSYFLNATGGVLPPGWQNTGPHVK